MKTVQATEAKNNFGKLIDDALVEPVTIQKNGRDVVVVLSFEEYRRLGGGEDRKALIDRLHEESMEKYGEVYRALAK
jgi:prevent-host-death family protein